MNIVRQSRIGGDGAAAMGGALGLITVTCGACEVTTRLADLTAGEVELALRDFINSDRSLQPYVGGEPVLWDYRLGVGEWLVLMKERGQKGAGDQIRIVVELGPASLEALNRIAVALEDKQAVASNPVQQHRTPTQSPYLDSQAAAEYLGINIKSLYGLVERRHVTPLRGPKRTYRFTTEMLDAYLRGQR